MSEVDPMRWISSNMEDEAFKKHLLELQVDVALKAVELKRLEKELEVFVQENEMRRLAGGFENLKMFRNRASLTPEQRKEFLDKLAEPSTYHLNMAATVTGRLSCKEPNPSNGPKSAAGSSTAAVVHILEAGYPRCRSPFLAGPPGGWPSNHKWVRSEEEAEQQDLNRDLFCSGCFQPAPKVATPKVFFLNEKHELPPLSKSQMRRDKKAARLEQVVLAMKASLSTHGKKGNAETKELRADIKKLEKRIKFFRTPKVKK